GGLRNAARDQLRLVPVITDRARHDEQSGALNLAGGLAVEAQPNRAEGGQVAGEPEDATLRAHALRLQVGQARLQLTDAALNQARVGTGEVMPVAERRRLRRRLAW